MSAFSGEVHPAAAVWPMLDEARPSRSGARDKDWREQVYGWARNHIPDEQNIVRHFAQLEVDRREGRATKRGNDLLRKWAKGQRPLFWTDIGPLPIIVDKVRVRLDAATPDDIEDAALEIETNGKAVYDEVVLLGRVLRDLARTARRQGLETVVLLGNMDPRKPDDGGALQPLSDEYGDIPDVDWDDEDDDDF